MPEQKGAAPEKTTQESAASKESRLSVLLEKVNVVPPSGSVTIDRIPENDKGAVVTAALSVFVDAIARMETPLEKIDKTLLDGLIAQLDGKMS